MLGVEDETLDSEVVMEGGGVIDLGKPPGGRIASYLLYHNYTLTSIGFGLELAQRFYTATSFPSKNRSMPSACLTSNIKTEIMRIGDSACRSV